MKKFLLCLTILLSTNYFLTAQCEDSTSPNPCVNSDILCTPAEILDYPIDMSQGEPPGPFQPQTLCNGNGVINNVSWVGFVAGATTITIELEVTNCTDPSGQGQGIQYGLFEFSDCESYSNNLACSANANVGTVEISYDNFELGATYVLFIDGFGGSICDIVFNITEGNIPYDLPDAGIPENNFDGMSFDPPLVGNEICLGATINFDVTPGPNAESSYYQWTIDPPTPDYPTGIINELPSTEDYNYNIDFNQAGTYEICGYPFTCCEEGTIECLTFEIVPIEQVEIPFDPVCFNELQMGVFPTGWQGPVITMPGDYSVQLQDPNYTCPFVQNVEVDAIDPQPTGQEFMIVCDPNNTFTTDICNVSVSFDQNGTIIECPGADINGCDSTILLYLEFINVLGILNEPTCANGMLVFDFTAGNLPGSNEGFDITFNFLRDDIVIWSETDATFNFSTDDIIVDIVEGQYYVEVVVEKYGQSCIFASNFEFVNTDNLLPPDPEIGTWALNPCILDSLSYQLGANNDPNNDYLWEVSPSTNLIIEDDSSSVIGINWENASESQVYTICVTADNGCGKSAPICEEINVIGQPLASYALADTMCITDMSLLTYTGTDVSGGGTYTWNFDGGTIAQPDSDNPGPFDLSFATTGKKYITVSVNQGSCASDAFIDSIVVVNPIDPPVISCMSSTDSIGFSWENITGEYEVNVIDAPGTAVFEQNGSQFSVTGLTPGDIIEIEVIAIDNGVCGNVSVITDCIAQNCPPIPIELPTIDTICLDANASTIDLDAIVDDPSMSGIESWSGNGIIDIDEGIFDPATATPGTHQIIFNYTTDCPYTDALTIVVLEQPVSTFEVEDTICISDFVTINYTGTFSNSSFDWDFDGGINTGDDAGPFDISWDSPGLKTISLGVSNIDCSSEVESRTVLVQEELIAPEIMCDAQTNDITFSWDPVANATNYEVFINGDSQGIQSTTTFFVDGLEPGNMVDITVVVFSDNKCVDVNSFTSCIALNCPPVIVNVTSNETSICLDNNTSPFQIDSEVVGGDSNAMLDWTGPGVNNFGVFDPTDAGVGVHEIILTYSISSCLAADTIVFNVLPTPNAAFTIENAICVTDSFHLEFTGEFDDVASFIFDLDGGNIEGTEPGPYVIWFDNAGTYDISLSLDENNCLSAPFSETVIVEEELALPNPGFSCISTTEDIAFSWPAVDCASEYIVFVNGVEIETIIGNSYTVEDLDPEQIVDFEIIAVSECACGDAYFSTNCTTEACPSLTANFDDVPAVCLTNDISTTQINVDIAGNPSVSNESWDGPGVNNSGLFDPSEAGPGVHTIDYSFEIQNCSYNFSTNVEVFESPSAIVIFDDPTCPGEQDGMINVEASGGSGDYEIFINNELLVGTSIDTLLGNSYSILVVDENNCSFSETIILNAPVDQPATIVGSTTVISTDTSTYTLDTDVPTEDINNITWFDTSGVVYCNDPSCINVDITPENDMVICVLVEYGDGCSSESCIDIRSLKIKQVFVPNTFTPDADGLNDVWTIFPNDEIIAMPLVQVFNRWGEKMFERENLTLDGNSPGWDGTFKGSKLNPGVYVYRLDLIYKDGTTETISSDITIMR